MPVIAEDSFVLGTVGQAPRPPWTRVLATAGTVEIANDPAAGARGNVLKIAETTGSTSDASEAKLTLPTSQAKLVTVFEFYAMQASRKLYIGFYAGGTRYDLVALYSDGKIKYKRASDSTFVDFSTPVTYSTVTWTRLRLVIDRTASSAELVAVTKDDVDVALALDLPSIPAVIDAIAFATDVSEDNGTFYVNDVQVLEKSAVIGDIVRNQQGALVSGVRVALVRHSSRATVADTTTDPYGRYSFTVDAGVFYDIVAYHDSLNTHGGASAPWVWAGAN